MELWPRWHHQLGPSECIRMHQVSINWPVFIPTKTTELRIIHNISSCGHDYSCKKSKVLDYWQQPGTKKPISISHFSSTVYMMPVCQEKTRLKEFHAENKFRPTQPISTVTAERMRRWGRSQPACTVHISGLLFHALVRQLTTFGVWFGGDISNNAAC